MASGERPSPEEIILYEKDPETKIATITFNRPEYPERADVGGAAALRGPAARRDGGRRRQGGRDPRRRRRFRQRGRPARLHGGHDDRRTVSPNFGWTIRTSRIRRRARSARRDDGAVVRQRRGGQPRAAGTQEDQHRRGQGLLLRLALLPVRRRRPGDLLRRRAVRPPVVPLLRVGAADVDLGADDGAAQRSRRWCSPGGRSPPQEMEDCNFLNKVVARDELEAEVAKYALGVCAEPARRHRVSAEDVLRGRQAAPG